MALPDTQPDYVDSADGTRLAFFATPAARPDAGPGVVFLGGFMSDMTGTKATVLEDWAAGRGCGFLRLDYSGHGLSGGNFRDGTIGRWTEDALTVIRHAGETVTGLGGPLVLVGSSMGAWIAILAVLELAAARGAQQAAGLVTIAGAPDFTADLMPRRLGVEALAEIEREGFWSAPSEYSDEPYIVTKALLDDGERHLVLRAALPLEIPARLIHGTADPDVPWTQSQKLMTVMTGEDVELILVKGGGHRLSEPADLDRLVAVTGRLCDQLSASSAASPAR